jgi:hypothetical protein
MSAIADLHIPGREAHHNPPLFPATRRYLSTSKELCPSFSNEPSSLGEPRVGR